jgi:hypothetical protein
VQDCGALAAPSSRGAARQRDTGGNRAEEGRCQQEEESFR